MTSARDVAGVGCCGGVDVRQDHRTPSASSASATADLSDKSTNRVSPAPPMAAERSGRTFVVWFSQCLVKSLYYQCRERAAALLGMTFSLFAQAIRQIDGCSHISKHTPCRVLLQTALTPPRMAVAGRQGGLDGWAATVSTTLYGSVLWLFLFATMFLGLFE